MKKELLRKFMEQAYEPGGYRLDQEKFARLIVEECVNVADTAEPYQSKENIKRHFGINQ